MIAVFLAGVALLAAGALPAGRWRVALVFQALGMAAIGAAGTAVLFGAGDLGAGFHGAFAPAFGVDRLSGFFLLTLAVIAVPAAVFAREPCAAPAMPARSWR
jgi:formate hydrogenlyase subunit 3/multisubunit Na+/H+ antiporter MnhD subunit